MRIAFVGVKRKYRELDPAYVDHFNRFHLELPYYFARDGANDVEITTVDHVDPIGPGFPQGSLRCITEASWIQAPAHHPADVVIHWRRWFPELHRPGAINLINCQDHSFNSEWQEDASSAFVRGHLDGILCFPTWHRRNLLRECPWLPSERAFAGCTLGVDTEVYSPGPEQDPHEMLWASDPGRGLHGAVRLAWELFRRDRRFRLNVCKPDYAGVWPLPAHPVVVDHGFVPNGRSLWGLFRRCGILPYTSTFIEPSSRSHRQAQAAGAMVLYPPGMGSPSELIEDGRTGVVSDPAGWADEIVRRIDDGSWRWLGARARELAVSENWAVQAGRFNGLIARIRGGT